MSKNCIITILITLCFSLTTALAIESADNKRNNDWVNIVTHIHGKPLEDNYTPFTNEEIIENLSNEVFVLKSQVEELEKYSLYVYCNLEYGDSGVGFLESGKHYSRVLFEVIINGEKLKSPKISFINCSGKNEYGGD